MMTKQIQAKSTYFRRQLSGVQVDDIEQVTI